MTHANYQRPWRHGIQCRALICEKWHARLQEATSLVFHRAPALVEAWCKEARQASEATMLGLNPTLHHVQVFDGGQRSHYVAPEFDLSPAVSSSTGFYAGSQVAAPKKGS